MSPENENGGRPDWAARAKAAHPPVPEDILDQVVPPLEALERAFGPLVLEIPPDGLAWDGPTSSGPEDGE